MRNGISQILIREESERIRVKLKEATQNTETLLNKLNAAKSKSGVLSFMIFRGIEVDGS